VTADSPFQLRGVNVNPGQGVPSWPAMAGDLLTAGNTAVTVSFSDGSTIILAPHALVKFDLTGQTPTFQLLDGSAHYTLTNSSSVKLIQGRNPVNPKNLIGDLSVSSNKWTTGYTAATLVGAGAAAALAVGIGRANGPSISPTTCNSGNGNGNGQPACQ
jgi:hypothetical protein